jgi:hypothetical protein
MRISAMLPLVLAPLSCGCSASTPRPLAPTPTQITHVAVLPALWITPGGRDVSAATSAAADGLRATSGVSAAVAVVPESRVDEDAQPCHEEPACVRRVGGELHARKAVVIKLAELGGTVLARVTLVDVEAGTQEQTRQTVVNSTDTTRVAQAVRAMAMELSRPFGPPPSPAPRPLSWYERWWVWAGGGGIAVSAIVIPLVVLRTRSDSGTQPSPDVVITPP